MTADYNGWQDTPEEEREALDALRTAPGMSSLGSKQALRMAEASGRGHSARTLLSVPSLPLGTSFSVLSVLSVLLLSACAGSEAQQAKRNGAQPIAVRAAPVIDTLLARPIVATGTVAHKDEIALSFKVGGVIARVAVDDGDAVRAGQVLATLQLREIEASLSKARSAATKADRDLRRAQRLYADSVVTLSQRQDAETASEIAHAELDAAAFNRRYAVIVAPAAGIVLRRSAEAGETVDPGATVLVLGGRVRGNVVEVGLADRDVVSVRKGDDATVRFDALPGQSFQGQVTQIDAAAEPGTGAYGVEISLPEGRSLVAGLVGRVEIQPSMVSAASLVPIESVLEADGSEATVYVLSADSTRAERRRVTVGFVAGSSVAVAGGLEGATAVLTDGAAYLDDGVAVEVQP